MPETFNPIQWVNDTVPALNANNLNNVMTGIETIDDRVASLESGIVTPVVVPFATSVTLNATQGCLFRCVASGDLTLDDIIGGTDGQAVVLEVQASGAQRTLHFTGSTSSVDIAIGQWWVGVFRYVVGDDAWLLEDGTGGGGSGGSGNDLNVLAPQNLPYAATITPNASTGALFRVTAPGNFTLANPANGTDGQAVVVEVLASGGARTVSFAGGYPAVTISSGTQWVGTLRYNATASTWVLATASNTTSAVSSVNGLTGAVVLNADNLADGSSKVMMTSAERTKLTGVATGATAYTSENARDDIGAALVAGANITITPNDAADTITIAATGSTGYTTAQDEGSALTQRATLNFVGSGVTVTDDAANSRTLVTIPGGGGSGTSVVVLEATEAVPASLADGTLVLRKRAPSIVETWTGTNGAVWTAADALLTPVWTTVANGGTVDINTNQGRVVSSATSGNFTHARRAGLHNADLRVAITLASTSAHTPQVRFRQHSIDWSYAFAMLPATNQVQFNYIDGATVTNLATQTFALSATTYQLRLRWDGSNFFGKLWTGATEPATWSITASDANNAVMGSIALGVASSGTAQTVRFDDLSVVDLS